MAHNQSRYRQHQTLMASDAAAWTDGWQLHVTCYGFRCAKGRYLPMRDLVRRFPRDTLGRLAQRAWCRGCNARPTMVWLLRPSVRSRSAERVNLIGGVG